MSAFKENVFIVCQNKVVCLCTTQSLETRLRGSCLYNIGFVGDFGGISLYKDEQQFETLDDSTYLILELDGIYEKLATFDGTVKASCISQNDIYFGGEFKTVNKTQSMNHIVRYNIQTNTFSSLNQGLDGPVYALYCDTQSVYIGGNFTFPVNVTGNYTGGVAEWSNNTWNPLPWHGFNGPIYTITKNQKTETILFGGRFDSTGDGMYFNSNTSQIIPLGSPTTISSGNGALYGNNSNPSSIVCPAKASPDSLGEVWYLQDNVPGYWDANFANPVEPTVFRLSNIQDGNRGTVSFNILALGLNEYFELSYTDPVTQQIVQCSEVCTLSNDTYQDFTVVTPKTTSGIRINIDSWYGEGGGLSFVQIFESDISVHPNLNSGDSKCGSSASSTETSITGKWKDVYVYGYYQNVLEATVKYSELATCNTSIVYLPNIPAQGQYNVYATTPGCVGSSNCFKRTQVEFVMEFYPGQILTTQIDQNTFSDQRVLLYSGFISPNSGDFRPSVTLHPAANATNASDGSDSVVIMADSLEFEGAKSAAIVSILEYDYKNTTASAVTWKPLNEQLPVGSAVYKIDASKGDILYIGGSFSSQNSTYRNIVSYNTTQGQLIPLPNIELNGTVFDTLLVGSDLYIGGSFQSTVNTTLLSNVARYDTTTTNWFGLENGVDQEVNRLIISPDNTTLTVSGAFRNRYSSISPILSIGNALWNVTNGRWDERNSLLVGSIVTDHSVNNSMRLYCGNILGAQSYRTDVVVSSQLSSRTLLSTSEPSSVSAGVYWNDTLNNATVPIIARRVFNNSASEFTAVTLLKNGTWEDIGSFDGHIYSLTVFKNWLYIGGQFRSISGGNNSISLTIYDLENKTTVSVSPVTEGSSNPGYVKIIKVHPNGKDILIGGYFSKIGAFDCTTVCMFNPSSRQWTSLGVGLTGTANDLIVSQQGQPSKIIALGDLAIGATKMIAATISDQDTTWASYASSMQINGIPQISVSISNDQTIIAGYSDNGSSFIGSLEQENFVSLTSNLGFNATFSQLRLVTINASISDLRYPSGTQNMLLAVGHFIFNSSQNASAVLFDGQSWHPYLLTTQIDGTPGIIRQIISDTPYNNLNDNKRHLSVAAVILISIGISIGILFVSSAAALGIMFTNHRNQAASYTQMPHTWNTRDSIMHGAGLFGIGGLGAAAAASRTISQPPTAGPSNHPVPESDIGDPIFPSQTPINAATVAAGGLTFTSLVAAARANTSSTINEIHPKLFYAKYPFKAQEYGELNLNPGDSIVVTDTTDNIWWLGYKDNGYDKPVSGVFPSNYVKT
ncbi:hypothetical protein K501DRAFT_322254 [Backusella circina FSU 941]|nr:hypothetical protein K501DRAFT_322254 [Backusella circina FSU 941]